VVHAAYVGLARTIDTYAVEDDISYEIPAWNTVCTLYIWFWPCMVLAIYIYIVLGIYTIYMVLAMYASGHIHYIYSSGQRYVYGGHARCMLCMSKDWT